MSEALLLLTLAMAGWALAGCAAPGDGGAAGGAPAGGSPPRPGDDLPEVRGEGAAPSDLVGRRADPRVYLEVRGQSGASPSPDGTRIAFLDRVTGVPQVWRVDGPLRWPEPVTHFVHRATSVRWSPRGDRLLVTGDVGGDERDDVLWVRPDGSDPVVVARGADGRHQVGALAPDGRTVTLASTLRHRAFFDLHVAATDGSGMRTLLESDDMNGAGAVSPDGTRMLHVRSFGSFRQELAVVDLATGERTRLLPDAPPCRFLDPDWAPDGRSVFVLTDRGHDFLRLVRIPLDGGGEDLWRSYDADIEALAVSQSTGWMAWVVNDRGGARLEAWKEGMDLDPLVLARGGVVGSPPVFAADAPVLVFGWGTATAPTTLRRVDLGAAEPHVEEWTRPDLAGLDPATLVEPEEVRFPSFDGLEISGFLYRCPRPSRSCVVVVHGGPEGQYRPSFDPVAQLLLARGHHVFAPNVRGSTGYGRAFAALDDGRKRMDSVADLAAVHDLLVARNIADRDRIAVMGGSYGGFMVLAALTHQPERWAAGVDIVGIAHLGTFLRNTGAFRQRHRAAEYGDPEADADFFEETAPLNHAHRIRAPLLVLQGKNDPRVPRSEAEQIVAAARANGVDVEYRLYENEGHGFARLENRIDAWTRSADFLDRVLRP